MFIRAESGKGSSVIYYDSDGSFTVCKGGSRAWRNTNPGNIRNGDFARGAGAIGKAGGFAVFPDFPVGRAALSSLLKGPNYVNLSIYNAVAKYAPPSQNDTGGYRTKLKNLTGLDLKRILASLNSSEFESVLNAIQVIEGYKVGNCERQMGLRVVGARKNKKTKTIEQYCLGNGRVVSKATGVAMADRNELVNAVAVHPKKGDPYLRAKPDNISSNNFANTPC